ncbi:hypothetical protein LEN26_003755, partial [Aphanomyces euteiches]
MKTTIDEERKNLQRELDQTVPEIQAAIASLNKINKLHITEMKSFTSPPDLVRLVMQAVCVLLGHGASPTWDDALFVLCDMRFLDKLRYYDKDNIHDTIMKKLDKYFQHPKFNEDEMKRASIASTSLCRWVLAMVRYHKVMEYVRPKQAKLETAHEQMESLECKVRAAMDAWKVSEAKARSIHSAWTENEAKRLATEKEFLKLRERTAAVDRVNAVFENLKPILRGRLKEIQETEGTRLLDLSSHIGLLGEYSTPQKEHTPFQMDEHMPSRIIENLQALYASSPLTANGVLTNFHLLHRWRHTLPYVKYPLLWDPTGVATMWIKSTERMTLEVISAIDPVIMSRLEMSLPNANVVILVDHVAYCEEATLWEILHALSSHKVKRPVFFVAEFDCTKTWSIRLLESFCVVNFELEGSDLEEFVVQCFHSHFFAPQETEMRALNERLLDDLRHRRMHIDSLIKQIALSKKNLLTCEDDMTTLVSRMNALTQVLGSIEIKSNAIIYHQNNRKAFNIIGHRGRILLNAASLFGTKSQHKYITMLRQSLSTLSTDVVIKPPIEVCQQLTSSFIREYIHGLAPEKHIAYCFYVVMGICENDHPALVNLCKVRISALREPSFEGLHICDDRTSPTLTHVVASTLVESTIQTCTDRILAKCFDATRAMDMVSVLDGSARIFVSRDGTKRSRSMVYILSKWQTIMNIPAFSGLLDDVDNHINSYEVYSASTPHSLRDLPSTAFTASLHILAKFILVALSHDIITESILHDVICSLLPDVQIRSLSLAEMAIQSDGRRPIALRFKPEIVVHPLWYLIESAMSTGIREDDISYFSFTTPEISALALRTLKEAALHGGWDLDRLRQSDIVELSRHLEGIAEGDFTVHSDFRLWLVNNNADNLFPTCDMKSYYFDPASVVRRGFSYVN